MLMKNPGAKSTVRSHMYPDIELSSNINCYRVVIDGDVLRRDENLAQLLDESNGWWGPDRVAIGLPVQSGTFYSLELTHPGTTGTAGDWSKHGDVNQLRETYADFEPVIVKLLAYVKSEDLLVWKLVQLPELETWVGKSGKVVLVADGTYSSHALVTNGIGNADTWKLHTHICHFPVKYLRPTQYHD